MKWWEKTPSTLSEDYENAYGITDDVTNSEVEFLINEASISLSSEILDLCCGTGRHSIRLAELGYNITGLDISSDFLRIAAEKSFESGLSIRWINRDMRNIQFEGKFDLVFIMFGAWGFFEEDIENYKVFQEVNQALKADGHFILDYFNRYWIMQNFQPFHWAERKTGYYLEKRQFDHYKGRLNTESVFLKRDGSVKKWETSIRAFTLQEILNMIQQSGLHFTNVYGDLEKHVYGLNTPRMILHAIK